MANRINGKQSDEYFKDYYRKNRARISARNKQKYHADRANPQKLLQHRQRATEATRRYRQRHPDRAKTMRKQVYDKRKYRAFSMVTKTGKVECHICGCDELSFLEINHINGGGCKEHRASGKIATMDRVLSGARNTDDLNLVCRLCNAWHYLLMKNEKQAQRYNLEWD